MEPGNDHIFSYLSFYLKHYKWHLNTFTELAVCVCVCKLSYDERARDSELGEMDSSFVSKYVHIFHLFKLTDTIIYFVCVLT